MTTQINETLGRPVVERLISIWLQRARSANNSMDGERSAEGQALLRAKFWSYFNCAAELGAAIGIDVENLRLCWNPSDHEFVCPKCGSAKLDKYGDENHTQYCLDCQCSFYVNKNEANTHEYVIVGQVFHPEGGAIVPHRIAKQIVKEFNR